MNIRTPSNFFALTGVLMLAGAMEAAAQWVRRYDAGTPGRRTSHAMAYDRDRGVTVLFGGDVHHGGSEAYFDDTWEYDGTQWRRITFAGAYPDNRSGHAMCYDSVHRRILLAGGKNEDGFLRDVWAYRSTVPGVVGVWERLAPLPALWYGGGLAGHSLTFDELNGVAVLVGGAYFYDVYEDEFGDGRGHSGHVFSFDGTIWRLAGQLPDEVATTTGNRARHGACYDRRHRRILLFGGNYLGKPIAGREPGDPGAFDRTEVNTGSLDTIEVGRALDGLPFYATGGWLPHVTQQCAMVYDEARDRLVVFGGQNDPGKSNRPGFNFGNVTIEFRGRPEYYSQPVYYPAIGQNGDPYHEEVFPVMTAKPPGRTGHAMIYDSRRRCVVMMGGADGSTRFDDTWELPSAPATGPVWVDVNYFGTANYGTANAPFQFLDQAIYAHAGGDMLFKGPRVTTQRGVTFSRPGRLRPVGGPVTLGAP